MRAASRLNEGLDILLARKLTDFVDPRTGAVKEHLAFDRVLFAGFFVFNDHRLNLFVGVVKAVASRIVQANSTVGNGRVHQGNRHTGIIELRVVETNAAVKSFGLNARELFKGFFLRENRKRTGVTGAELGHHRVEGQSETVEGLFVPAIARQNERVLVNQVRNKLQKQFAFTQRFENQTPIVRVLHVANAAVNELGRARARAFGKVLCID